uniref:Protein krueppel n=1 Tax=Anopheles christyi TaxID=43041 RepID=A0A182K5P6_9DIPT
MVHTLRKITNICRLCLCEEVKILIPTKDVFNSSLTPEDVERFTGVQIPTDDNVPYVICTDCRNSLIKSVSFRNSCARNDRLYIQLFSELIIEIRNEVVLKQHPKRIVKEPYGDSDEYQQAVISEIAIVKLEDAVSNDASINQEQFLSSDEDHIKFENHNDPNDSVEFAASKANVRSCKGRRGIRPKAKRSNKKMKSPQLAEQDDVSNAFSTEYLDWPYFTKQLCDICGQMITNFKRHLLSHTKEAMYACPHCSIKMTDSSNLVRHINAVHMKTIVKTCETCGKGFTHYNTYNSHMRSMHGIGEKYECKICQKLYIHKKGLREHISRVHTYESKFECKLCSKRFKTRRALNIHGRVHSDNQPYACSHCPKRFKSGYARNTHQLTHTGITFSCGLCNKSYRYKSLLSMHMRKLHPETVVGAEPADDCVADDGIS